jgi:hypothetical protein
MESVMALIDLNKQERDAKRDRIRAQFTWDEGMQLVTWFLEDADVARGYLARQVMRRHMERISPWERQAEEFGRQHFDRFTRRVSELPEGLRIAIIAYVSEGFSDPIRKSRWEAVGDDARIISELLDRPLSDEALKEVRDGE